MTTFKCPYCSKDSFSKTSLRQGQFNNWVDVRNHLSRCLKNTKEYVICEYYGPLKTSILNTYQSIEHLKKDYPNITFNHSHWKRFRKANKLQLRTNSSSKEECLLAIQNFYKENNRIPQAREFSNTQLKYPNYSVYYKHFDSWNQAIELAGFIPSLTNGYGIKTYAKDGMLYNSGLEAYFVNHFLFEKEEYEYEKPYGDGHLSDFYLSKYNLYIEIDGDLPEVDTGYRSRMNNKIQYCKEHNIKLLVLTKKEIYKKDFRLSVGL